MLLKNSSYIKIFIMRIGSFFFSIYFLTMLGSSLSSSSIAMKTSTNNLDLSSIDKTKSSINDSTTFVSPNSSFKETVKKNYTAKIVKKVKIHIDTPIEITTDSVVQLRPIKINTAKKNNWVSSYKPFVFKATKTLIAKTVTDKKINNTKIIKITNTSDRISTALAANEKSYNVEVVKKLAKSKPLMKVESDDLVFFDYSSNSKDDLKLNHGTKSKEIKTSINNLSPSTTNFVKKVDQDKGVIKEISKPSNLDLLKNNSSQLKTDYASMLKTKESQENSVKRTSNFNSNFLSEYSIAPVGIGKNGYSNKLSSFELRFSDDIDEILQNSGSGKISFSNNLNSEISIRRATLFSSGFIPTVMDMVFEANIVNVQVPVFSKDFFDSIIAKNKLRGLGGHLLVELDDLTEDVNVDNQKGFEAKLYLNKHFKVVSPEDSDYSYIFFVGVNPGNSILSFRTTKNEVTSKIVHVENDFILFDSNYYVESKRDSINFFEEYLLSKKPDPLNVVSSKLKNFSFDTKYTKKKLNQIESNRALYPLGTRKYLELSHLEESIFIGYWDKTTIDLPSEEYINFIIKSFNNSNFYGQCVVQLNLSKSAKEMSYNGSNGLKAMNVEKLLLDKDGKFYDDFSLNTRKAFLMGQDQGIINIRVTYVDGSKDFLQTYCSNSTYLVEQL